MRLMPISNCRSGMRLARPIYNEDGVVLLAEHVELTEMMIRRLEKIGFLFLYIEDPRTDDLVIPEMISTETRIRAVGEVRKQFRRLMSQGIQRTYVGRDFFGAAFRDVVTMLIDDLSKQQHGMIMLTNLCIADHYLYQHSVNVCIYATILGMACGYSREELLTLGMGALLHDIGKTQISQELILKPGKLTNEEIEKMKLHTEYGFRILKDEPNISLTVAHCAYQHHERIDGSGYPRGLRGGDIHEYARWIGLVDSYDAMTTNRIYRSAMLPHQALESLFVDAGKLYDFKMVEILRDRLAIYPIGSEVTLNTGEKGIVVDLNASSPQRPVVRILANAEGEELSVPYEVDLSRKLSLMITSVSDVKINPDNKMAANGEYL